MKYTQGRYILDEQGKPKIEIDPAKWADWIENKDNVHIAFDWFESNGQSRVYVSTVFTGEDYNSQGQGEPILFETQVYDDVGVWEELTKSYVSKGEALIGHSEILKYLGTDDSRVGVLRKAAVSAYSEWVSRMAEKIAGISATPFASKEHVPNTGGVYIIYNNDADVIYIGKAGNLRRRLYVDHLSAELRDTMSSFRRSVNSLYDIPYGPDMRNWIIESCKFTFLEVGDPDMRSLLETFLIRCFRTPNLLNKT